LVVWQGVVANCCILHGCTWGIPQPRNKTAADDHGRKKLRYYFQKSARLDIACLNARVQSGREGGGAHLLMGCGCCPNSGVNPPPSRGATNPLPTPHDYQPRQTPSTIFNTYHKQAKSRDTSDKNIPINLNSERPATAKRSGRRHIDFFPKLIPNPSKFISIHVATSLRRQQIIQCIPSPRLSKETDGTTQR